MKCIRLLYSMILLLLLSGLYAQSETDATVFFPYVMGMGEAGIAYFKGFHSFFYNPANFGLLKKDRLMIANLSTRFNSDFQASYQNSYKLMSIIGSDIDADTLNLLSSIKAGAGVSVPFCIAYNGHGIALAMLNTLNLDIATTRGMFLNPLARLFAVSDIVFVGGYSLRLPFMFYKRDEMYLGIGLRFIYRMKVDMQDDFLTIASSINNLSLTYNTGNALAIDVGYLWKINTSFSIAFAIKDIGNTKFTWKRQNGTTPAPTYISPTYTIGISYHPDLYTLISLPYYIVDNTFINIDILYNEALDFSDYYRIGVGFRFISLFDLVVGYNYGRINYGLKLKSGPFELEAASFAYKYRFHPTKTIEQNYIVSFALVF